MHPSASRPSPHHIFLLIEQSGAQEATRRAARRVWWLLWRLRCRSAGGRADRLSGAWIGCTPKLAAAARRRGLSGLSQRSIERAMPLLRAIGAVGVYELRRMERGRWRTLPSIYLPARSVDEVLALRLLHAAAAKASTRASLATVIGARRFLSYWRSRTTHLIQATARWTRRFTPRGDSLDDERRYLQTHGIHAWGAAFG